MAADTKRNQQIEGLRGAAILLVVSFHLIFKFQQVYMDPSLKIPAVDQFGDIGVLIFLVISSYFVIDPAWENGFILRKFYLKKALRLWPLYAVCITITFAATHVWLLPGRTVSLKNYFLNLFFINGYINFPYVDGAHWYLTVLISLILMVGIFYRLKIGNNDLTYLLWLFASAALQMIHPGWTIAADILKGVSGLIGSSYVGVLVVGLMLRKISVGDSGPARPHRLLRLEKKEAITMLAGFAYTFFFRGTAYTVYLAAAFLLVCLCLYGRLRVFSAGPLVCLGEASYAIYLIHQNISYIVEYQLCKIMPFGIFHVVLAFCVALGGGFLIHFFLEKPIDRIIQKQRNDSGGLIKGTEPR